MNLNALARHEVLAGGAEDRAAFQSWRITLTR
jgi:hypothetical protein